MLPVDAMTLSVLDLSATRPVRVAVVDPNGGGDITGMVRKELSATHVLLEADDGLSFMVEKASLRILPRDEVA
ncbi:hypothetical protein [Methylobacterium aquaticum]|uniref:hypothetical protein n=1 Tax=Methylobacterium aquaticum TaxID=270351 RepID=UPI001932AE2F|nr:hypothetical protein [Methylobacterium aquaticum]QRE74406.1 hypothetical protein F1D61_13040 [Methylobacterium aquaticum]